MNTGFITELQATPLADGKLWRLGQDLVWQWPDGTQETCEAGFITDFASVPDLSLFAAMVIAVAFLLHWWPLFWAAWLIAVFAKRIDDDDRTDAPAAFHDQDYYRRDKKRAVADWHLVVRMRANKVGWWKCILYWINLRLFGWTHWYFGRHLD